MIEKRDLICIVEQIRDEYKWINNNRDYQRYIVLTEVLKMLRGDSEIQEISCSNYCDNCRKADCKMIQKMIRKLANYEDAEEQGLLIKLPCKVGDAVYVIEDNCSFPNDCGNDCNFCPNNKREVTPTCFTIDMFNDIGDTVFLTRKEAEQKLKEMEVE